MRTPPLKFGLIVINLERSADRLRQISAQLEARGLAFVRLVATDARALPDSERDRYYSAEVNRAQYHKQLSPGEIACYISHRRAWQLLLETGWDFAVILEDDVTLTANFEAVLRQLPHLPADWDVIKLGSSSTKPIIAKTELPDGLQLCAYTKVPICNHAQAVSRRGAEKLLARPLPFGRPVDVDLQFVWETGAAVYGLEPYCTRVDDELPSEIWKFTKRNFQRENPLRSLRYRARFALRLLGDNSGRHGIFATLKTMLFGGLPHP